MKRVSNLIAIILFLPGERQIPKYGTFFPLGVYTTKVKINRYEKRFVLCHEILSYMILASHFFPVWATSVRKTSLHIAEVQKQFLQKRNLDWKKFQVPAR